MNAYLRESDSESASTAVGTRVSPQDPLWHELRRVAEAFQRDGLGELTEVVRPRGGHIHLTAIVQHESAAGRGGRRVYQRLHRGVFPDPIAVVRNVARVTGHVRAALSRRGESDLTRRCLRLIPTRDGADFHLDSGGQVWRCSDFIEGSASFAVAPEPHVAEQASFVFGELLALLVDLPPNQLTVVIPHFHDLPHRIEQLIEARARDSHARGASVASDLDATSGLADAMRRALAERGADALPRRVVHNDCKLDNALLDAETLAPLCAIDLDTCMEGDVLCDFGDLARTATNPAPEDERDLSRVAFDLEAFAACARGFLAGAGPALSARERAALPLAGPLLACENAVRFLTDHLNGDVYFRVTRPGQNLDRARAQRTLASRMLSELGRASQLVERAAR